MDICVQDKDGKFHVFEDIEHILITSYSKDQQLEVTENVVDIVLKDKVDLSHMTMWSYEKKD